MGGMNWFDVLPPTIARRQIAWERRRMSRRMHDLGFTYAQIGERMGVSTVRAQQLGHYWDDRPGGHGSPAAKWIGAGFEFKPPLLRCGADTARWATSALDGFTVES